MKTVLVKLLFYVFVGVGLIFQLKDVMKDYFAYKTSSKVELLRRIDTENPTIVFCVRFNEILNRSNFKKYDIHPKRHDDSNITQHELSVLTVKDIFDLTPDPKDVMEKCEYRKDSYQIVKYSKEECYKLLKVKKYFSQKEICYLFLTKRRANHVSCHKVSLSIYNRRKIYAIRLNDEFRGSHTISMMSYFSDRTLGDNHWWILPQESRKYATSILRLSDFDKNLTEHSAFYISHAHYKFKFMPPPYDTMCTAKSDQWKIKCETECSYKVYQRYSRIPPDGMSLIPLNLKVISKADLKNKTMMRDIEIEEEECMRDCVYDWCTDHFTVTEVIEALTKHDKITLASTCSMSPTHKLIFYPKHSLDELLIYTTSSFGVWFGFSFVSLNPTSLISRFKRRKRKTKTTQMPKVQLKNTTVKTIRQPAKFKLCIPTPENQQQCLRPRNVTRPTIVLNLRNAE